MTDTTIATNAKPKKTFTPKPPAALAKATVLWLWVYAAVCVVSGAGAAWETFMLSRGDPAEPMGFGDPLPGASPLAEAAIGLSAIAEVLMLIVTGFIVLKWIYRVNLNAKALSPGKSVSPGWSVGWFFVPFASLVMPFRGVREAWQISTDPERPNSTGVPDILRWWWGVWLIANIAGNLSFRLGMSMKNVGGQLAGDFCNVVATAANIICAVILIRIVRELTARQVNALSRATFD